MIIEVVAMAVLLPIFRLSVAVIAAGSRLARVRAYPLADPDRKASGNVQDGSSSCGGSGNLVDGVGRVSAATPGRH
jgi:hypothetical protein